MSLRKGLVLTLLVIAACDEPSEKPRVAPASSETAKPTACAPAATASSPPADPKVKRLEDAAKALLDKPDGDASAFLAPAKKIEAWFTATFGDRAGNVLLNKWQDERGKDPKGDLAKTFKEAKDAGGAQVKAIAVDYADAPEATGTQKSALKLARQNIVLYTLRFLKDDGSRAKDVASFTMIDGSYVYLGRMAMAIQLVPH